MFALATYNGNHKINRGLFTTAEAARAAIPGPLVLWEEDADHPNHFDAFGGDSNVYTVTPIDSKFA